MFKTKSFYCKKLFDLISFLLRNEKTGLALYFYIGFCNKYSEKNLKYHLTFDIYQAFPVSAVLFFPQMKQIRQKLQKTEAKDASKKKYFIKHVIYKQIFFSTGGKKGKKNKKKKSNRNVKNKERKNGRKIKKMSP